MLAAAETTAASDMGCKRRRSPAMAEEKLGCEAAEESRGGAAWKKAALPEKKAELLVLQRKKMYVATVPLKKRGCAAGEGVCWLR
jgi:hypothetical protein